MQQIPGIGWLRGVAALLVLASHVSYWCGGSGRDVLGGVLARGDVGVAIFFSISAFLLVRPGTHDSTRAYTIKRAGRILPAYWLVLLAVVTVAALLGSPASVSQVFTHVVMLQGFSLERFQGFSQAWSLTTEVSFYCAVPWLRTWLRRLRAEGRQPWLALGTASLAGLLLQGWSATSGIAALSLISTSAPAHALWFCVGLALRWVWDSPPPSRQPTLGASLAWAGALYLALSTPLGGPTDLSTPHLAQAVCKEVGYTFIAWHALRAALAVPASPAMRSGGEIVGDLSYGVFLWHVLVLQILFTALALPVFHAPLGWTMLLTAVVSVSLARLTWVVIERPALRRASAFAHRA